MRAKVLLRSIGLIALILGAGVAAYAFVSDNNQDTSKGNTDATQNIGTEIAEATDTAATEEVSDITETPKTTEAVSEVTETPQNSVAPTEGTGQDPVNTPSAEVTTTAAPVITPAPVATAAPQPAEPAVKTYTLVVTKGTSARQIANRLEANGIIANADEFTQVLVNRGVTEDINVGSFEFTSDYTYDQIIAALTGKQK